MKVFTDDAIHAQGGELIEVRGSVLPFPIRYQILAVSVPVFAVSCMILWKILGVMLFTACLYSAAASMIAAWKTDAVLTKDVTIKGIAQITAKRIEWWWKERNTSAKTNRKTTRISIPRIPRKNI